MSNKKFWIAALCLGLTISGGSRLQAADKPKPQTDETKAKMEAQGWKQIDIGVYERQLGPNKVEHMGFGREGLAWTIGELTRQLENVRQDYQKYPSEDLAKIIDQLTIKIAGARSELRNMAKNPSSMTAANSTGCSICYSATANAYPLTSSQGVGATADASFNSNCGYSGDTYAYAYAQATLSGTTTTHSQSDPHTGTSVTSHATASANGSTNCSSNANAYAQSTALGISYTTSASNTSCPVVSAPSVSISGPSYISFVTASCSTKTWSATVTGGTAPYSYQWRFNGTAVGTNSSSYSRSICYSSADFTIQVTVTDANSQTATASYPVTVDYSPGDNCNPICP
jgi:hypothetical protein